MYEVKCSDCGKPATVPFQPKPGKPVYCRACFSKHTLKQTNTVGRDSGFDPKQAWARRRNNGEERKEEKPTSIFHRS
jgi:CxxC-x17-CxxC domain-containing protein